MRGFQAVAFMAAAALALLLVLVLAHHKVDASSEAGSMPKTFDFGAYLQEYRKAYDRLEAMNRAKLFYSRTLGIFKTNMLYATRKIDYFVRQNQFTDYSPEEMKKELAFTDSDLRPVDEARLYPDTPADMFVLDERGTPSDQVSFEPMTKSSLSDLGRNAETSSMDFFKDAGEDVDVRQLLQELHQDEGLAKDMSKVIEMHDRRRRAEKYRLERARMENHVVHKPYVAPTNADYDPSSIQTQGWVENTELFGKRYAQYMMDDFMGSLDPYPTPVAPSQRVLKTSDGSVSKTSPSQTGILSGFMDSIHTLKSYFSWDFSDEDEEDDDEEFHDAHEDLDLPVNRAPEEVQSDPAQRRSTQRRSEIRYDVDWRKTGCISAIKSQDHCNSCATFASLDMLEFLYCRQKKTATEFSAQFVIDCGSIQGLSGCQGGKLSSVGMFIKRHGLQLSSLYPYRAREQQCPYAAQELDRSSVLKPDLTAWRLFSQISSWYQWIPKTPVIVGINMPSDFLGYSGGIHDGQNCVPGMVHAMLLVGSGKEDGKPFWLLKNSFADTWGEEGYFRLSKKAPIKCFNSAVVAVAKFDQ